MMQVRDITDYLDFWAPPALQESFDNAGLLLGDPEESLEKVLVSLDVTEAVVEEAHRRGAGLIVAHHPLIFGGLHKLTGSNYVERSVMKALRYGIAVYATHTNLDLIADGVNQRIGEKLGIARSQVLEPQKGLLKKLVVFVPQAQAEPLRDAIFGAGAGAIGDYDQCSYALEGTGSFRPGEEAQPAVGQRGSRHYEPETRLEFLLEDFRLGAVLAAMQEAHPYEEVAYDVIPLDNAHAEIGHGRWGQLERPVDTKAFLQQIKATFGGVLRYTDPPAEELQTIAWCGGSGSFLIPAAKRAGVDLFLTSDIKYHQFFEAEDALLMVDIGHYENEQFTKNLLAEQLTQKFNNFAVLLAEENTNPINYL